MALDPATWFFIANIVLSVSGSLASYFVNKRETEKLEKRDERLRKEDKIEIERQREREKQEHLAKVKKIERLAKQGQVTEESLNWLQSRLQEAHLNVGNPKFFDMQNNLNKAILMFKKEKPVVDEGYTNMDEKWAEKYNKVAQRYEDAISPYTSVKGKPSPFEPVKNYKPKGENINGLK